MDERRESENIIEELEDIIYEEYILNLLSELKDNVVFKDVEIKKLRVEIKRLKVKCNSHGKRLVLLGENDITFYATDLTEALDSLQDGE